MEPLKLQFEKWWEKWCGEEPFLGWERFRTPGGYNDQDIHAQWEAYKGSREDIEIESPAFIDSREALAKGFTVDYSNGFGDGMDAYEANIRAAGLRVKEK